MSGRQRALLGLLFGAGLLAGGLAWYVQKLAAPSMAVREPAPGFELAALEGKRISLADLRGKVVYVNFWATWCAPCRSEAPALQKLYAELGPEGFEIIAPTIDTLDSVEQVAAFRDEFGLTFPILLDPDRIAYTRYGATGVPETYLIDAEGNLAEAYIGPRNWEEPRYARTIRRLLAARDASHRATGG